MENVDGSGSFYRFQTLCRQIASEPSHTGKAALVRAFLDSSKSSQKNKIDLYYFFCLLLPKVDSRVYNIKAKRIIQVFFKVLFVFVFEGFIQ